MLTYMLMSYLLYVVLAAAVRAHYTAAVTAGATTD
jgi:hypothetical protein